MNHIQTKAVFTLLAGGLLPFVGVPGVSADDDIAERVLAMAQAHQPGGPMYVYDMEFNLDGLSVLGTVDMSADQGERLIVTSPPASEWSEDFTRKVNDAERELESDIWCQQMIDDVAGYESFSVQDGAITYVVTMRTDESDKGDAKFAKHIESTMTVSIDDGAVLNFSVHAPKPFKPALVARIKRLDISMDCNRSPDGRTFMSSMRAEVEGRAFMKKFSEVESRNISNLRLP